MHFTEYDTRLAGYAVIVDAADRILCSWFNGGNNWGRPGWSLPGGGVEYDESIEQAVVREVYEETGYDVELGAPLMTSCITDDRRARPHKSVRILYTASVCGGSLGTVEVGGTTDRADWLDLQRVATESHTDLVDTGIRARLSVADVPMPPWPR